MKKFDFKGLLERIRAKTLSNIAKLPKMSKFGAKKSATDATEPETTDSQVAESQVEAKNETEPKKDEKGFNFSLQNFSLQDLQKNVRNVKRNILSRVNSKQKNANLVYYNPESKFFYYSSGGKVIQYTKTPNSSLRVASLISFDSLLKTNVEVPRTTEEEDIDDFVIETAYRQLNIAADADYQVSFSRVDANFDADNWNYDVYAIETRNLDNIYHDLVERTTFIDVITSVAFLPLALYKKGRLDVIDNHIFAYIDENSGVFAFYSKGEPVFIKTLTYTMYRLRLEFNQETSLELSAPEFEAFIAGESAEAAEHKSSIDSMIEKIGAEIEENILYIKRIYPDLDPTTLYFGMSSKYNDDFLPTFRETFLMDTRPFTQLSFVPTVRGDNAVADITMHYMDLYVSDMNIKLPNFSYVKRPKPLNQRESGQFVMIASACLVLSLVNPLYNIIMSGFYNFRAGMLQSDYDNVVFPKAEEYRGRETNMKTQIENLQTTQSNLNQTIATLRGNMSDIHTWQVGYIQKSKVVDDILRVAKSSDVSIVKYTAIANNNQQLVVELHLFARNQQDITDFIRNLNSQKTYKSVTTEKIEKFGADILTTTPSTANAKPNTAPNATNMVDKSVINAMSAKYDFVTNPDLENRVGGYLNSIVRVVVR